jgi:hypothetical protein
MILNNENKQASHYLNKFAQLITYNFKSIFKTICQFAEHDRLPATLFRNGEDQGFEFLLIRSKVGQIIEPG